MTDEDIQYLKDLAAWYAAVVTAKLGGVQPASTVNPTKPPPPPHG